MSASPTNYRTVYSADQIAQVVTKLGAAISPWCEEMLASTHREVLAVPLMKGAMFFAVDLLRNIPASVELAPLKVSTYLKGVNAVQKDTVSFSLAELDIQGRVVLLIDVIRDSGKTLSAVSEAMIRLGAQQVRSVVLIDRKVEPITYTAYWKGFEYDGDEWFVGYGFDDSTKWRHLPYVAIIES